MYALINLRRRRLRAVRLALVAAVVAATNLTGVPRAGAAFPVQADVGWQTNGIVHDVVRVGSHIVIAGTFTELSSPDGTTTVARNQLASLNAATGAPTGWDPDLNGAAFALALSPDGQRLWVAGSFTKVGSATRSRIAAFDMTGPTPILHAWKPVGAINSSVRAVAVTETVVYLGGLFTKVGTTDRLRLAALDPATGDLLPWAPTADAVVHAIVPTPTRVYVGGAFKVVNGVSTKTLAALDPTTGAAQSCPCHPGYPALDLAANGDTLFVAGAGAGGRAAAYDLATGVKRWEAFADGNVQAVAVQGSFVYFGGHYLKMSSKAVGEISRHHPTTGALDLSWLPTFNGFEGIRALAGDANRLWVGGDFTFVGGRAQRGFAQFTDPDVPNTVDLAITMSDAPDPINATEQVTFTINVANHGLDPARNVAVRDTLASSLTFVDASPGCTHDPVLARVTCALGTLDPGASVTRVITATATEPGEIANSAVVTTTDNDTNPGNNEATTTTSVGPAVGTDLEVIVDPAAATVPTGSPMTWTIHVDNDGSVSASNTALAIDLPPDATLDEVSASAGTCSETSGGAIACQLGDVAWEARVTVVVTMTSPPAPLTLSLVARVSSDETDVNMADNQRTSRISVSDGSADSSPPALLALEMLDEDANGRVDRIDATFDEPLAQCPATSCAAGWSATDVPSSGVPIHVTVTGSVASLHLEEGDDDVDTAVGQLRVSLAADNEIQDLAGNHPSFGPTSPLDRAGPVPVAVRKANVGTQGIPDPGDRLISEWSETLAASSVPGSTSITFTDPPGAGNETLTIPLFAGNVMDISSDSYLLGDDTWATFADSPIVVKTDTLQVTVGPACTGPGCGSLAMGKTPVLHYVAPAGLTDAAGNPAVGSFTKTELNFRLF